MLLTSANLGVFVGNIGLNVSNFTSEYEDHNGDILDDLFGDDFDMSVSKHCFFSCL